MNLKKIADTSFNDIWRMVRINMYVLDYVVWFLVGSISAIVQIKSDI